MPKAKKARRSSSSTAAGASKKGASGETSSKLTRGQRKRYARRERFVNKLLFLDRKKRDEERRDVGEALYDVSALEKELESARSEAAKKKEAVKSKGARVSNKKRRKLELAEMERMRKVMEHPAFVADPIATIHTHLTNTL